MRKREETWRPGEELGSSDGQMDVGDPWTLTMSSQKFSSRKQISNNEVNFMVKLFLLNTVSHFIYSSS